MIVVRAEGARIGLVMCDGCSAAVVVDPRDSRDRVAEHVAWHAEHQKQTELVARLTASIAALLEIRDADEDCSADDLRDLAGAALVRAA